MQKPPPVFVAQKAARYMLAGAVMLALRGTSLVPLFRGTDDVRIITTFFASITVLPLGLIALLGGVSGSEAGMPRGRIALFAAGGLLALIVAAEVLRRMIYAAGNYSGCTFLVRKSPSARRICRHRRDGTGGNLWRIPAL